jgi:hypothetical protein
VASFLELDEVERSFSSCTAPAVGVIRSEHSVAARAIWLLAIDIDDASGVSLLAFFNR